MRKAIVSTLAIVLLALSYLAWPMLSALQLKLAIRDGDLPTIERKVDWPALRASLKASLVENAGAAAWLAGRDAARNSTDSNAKPQGGGGPSLWQRLKSTIVPGMVESTLNQLMTPAGLAKAYATREDYRHKWRPAVGFAKPPRALDGTWFEGGRLARFLDSLDRIDSVAFTSWDRVEVEVIDRYQPERHFITIMGLQNFSWKLIGLRVLPPREPA